MTTKLKKYVFAICGEIVVEAKDPEDAQSVAYDKMRDGDYDFDDIDVDFQGLADGEDEDEEED